MDMNDNCNAKHVAMSAHEYELIKFEPKLRTTE